jgi:hypothetical protein
MSIFLMVIIASNVRLASVPLAKRLCLRRDPATASLRDGRDLHSSEASSRNLVGARRRRRFPKRWRLIKSGFSRALPPDPGRSREPRQRGARRASGSAVIWEHAIRDDGDLARHIDYVHFNPVAHGLVSRVRDWPYSSFHAHVAAGALPEDWAGDMREMAPHFGERRPQPRGGRSEAQPTRSPPAVGGLGG